MEPVAIVCLRKVCDGVATADLNARNLEEAMAGTWRLDGRVDRGGRREHTWRTLWALESPCHCCPET